MSITAGLQAEEVARDYLKIQGMKWIESNYRCRLGEIDLIMRDGEYLVFIEVRSRSSVSHGGALESITYHKQQKLVRTASLYLLIHKLHDKVPIRFDVVSIEGKNQQLTWIKNAFTG